MNRLVVWLRPKMFASNIHVQLALKGHLLSVSSVYVHIMVCTHYLSCSSHFPEKSVRKRTLKTDMCHVILLSHIVWDFWAIGKIYGTYKTADTRFELFGLLYFKVMETSPLCEIFTEKKRQTGDFSIVWLNLLDKTI